MLRRFAAGLLAALLLLPLCLPLAAAPPPLQVEHPYARATPPGAPVGAAYFRIENHGPSADRLLAVSTPAAESAEVHEMKMEGDVMRMRKLPSLEIAAGAGVSFTPDGYHVMLNRLGHPLVAGESIRLSLRFEHAGVIDVTVPVIAIGAPAP